MALTRRASLADGQPLDSAALRIGFLQDIVVVEPGHPFQELLKIVGPCHFNLYVKGLLHCKMI